MTTTSQDWPQELQDPGKVPDYEQHFGPDDDFVVDQVWLWSLIWFARVPALVL